LFGCQEIAHCQRTSDWLSLVNMAFDSSRPLTSVMLTATPPGESLSHDPFRRSYRHPLDLRKCFTCAPNSRLGIELGFDLNLPGGRRSRQEEEAGGGGGGGTRCVRPGTGTSGQRRVSMEPHRVRQPWMLEDKDNRQQCEVCISTYKAKFRAAAAVNVTNCKVRTWPDEPSRWSGTCYVGFRRTVFESNDCKKTSQINKQQNAHATTNTFNKQQ